MNIQLLRRFLIFAGIYNIIWGAITVFFPSLYFDLVGIDTPRYPSLWQCIGMIVGVYGIAYIIASVEPILYWPITFVGLLGKIFGPIGFAFALWQGELPVNFGYILLTNDLIWWIPFGMILYAAYDHYIIQDQHTSAPYTREQALREMRINTTQNLFDLSHRQPLLVAFLRHSGCTFCRETIDLIARQQETLLRENTKIIIVVPSHDKEPTLKLCKKYGLKEASIIRDGDRIFYKSFGLYRGTLRDVLGWRVWLSGAIAFLKGYGIGALDGDGFQMPGYFYLARGKVICETKAVHAGDMPNFEKLCNCIEEDIKTGSDQLDPVHA